jgi:hypothetical protein
MESKMISARSCMIVKCSIWENSLFFVDNFISSSNQTNKNQKEPFPNLNPMAISGGSQKNIRQKK